MSRERIKREAKRLQKLLPAFVQDNKEPFALSACQELAARVAGFNSFHDTPKGNEGTPAGGVATELLSCLTQVEVAVSSAVLAVHPDATEIGWASWITLVDVHDELVERAVDIFNFQAIAANIALRLHYNPFDLIAVVTAIDLHGFTSYTDAEPFIETLIGHVYRSVEYLQSFDGSEVDFLSDALIAMDPEGCTHRILSYLMMAAVEQGKCRAAARYCMEAMKFDELADGSGLLNAGIACALETGDLGLVNQVLSEGLGIAPMSSTKQMIHLASDPSRDVVDPSQDAFSILALLSTLAHKTGEIPQSLMPHASVIRKVLEGDVLATPFTGVVSKPDTGGGSIGPEAMRVDVNLSLAAARFVARYPKKRERLMAALEGRSKLH